MTPSVALRRAAEAVGSAGFLYPIAAAMFALLSAGILLAATGTDAIGAFANAYDASLGSRFALSTTIVKSLPRLFAALGIAVALRAGLWNIGAEGQLYLGAVGATAVTLWLPSWPGPIVILLAVLAGIAGGALWGLLPGVLRAYREVNEVITSLMLVYVGIQFASYLIQGPWVAASVTFPATEPLPHQFRFPLLVTGTVLNAGVLIALLAVAIAWVLLERSVFGVDLNAVGGNPDAARALGTNVRRTIVVAFLVSGGFAALAGVVDVLGARGRLVLDFSPGYGFEAIAIALLGRLRPGGIMLASLLFGALAAGGAGLQASGEGISASIVQLTGALAVVYLLVGFGLASWRSQRRAAVAALAERGAEQARKNDLTKGVDS